MECFINYNTAKLEINNKVKRKNSKYLELYIILRNKLGLKDEVSREKKYIEMIIKMKYIKICVAQLYQFGEGNL